MYLWSLLQGHMNVRYIKMAALRNKSCALQSKLPENRSVTEHQLHPTITYTCLISPVRVGRLYFLSIAFNHNQIS